MQSVLLGIRAKPSSALVSTNLQVVLTIEDDDFEEGKPTILLDGGQRAGTDSVGFTLFVMSQLVACEEHDELLRRAKWVFIPSANPDGQEYQRSVSGHNNIKHF